MAANEPLPLTAAALSAVLAGVSLLLMMLTGAFLGLSLPAFHYLFVAHLSFLCLSGLFILHGFCRIVITGRTWSALIILLWFAALVYLTKLPITDTKILYTELGMIKAWISADRIFELRSHGSAFLPSLGAIAYAGFATEFLTEFSALYHLSYLLLTALITGTFIYHKTNNALVAVATVLITLALPVVSSWSVMPGSYAIGSFYFALACAAAISWANHERAFLNLLITGACLGLAVGSDSNTLAFPIIFIPALAVVTRVRGATLASALMGSLACAAIALVLFLPWMLRNFYWTLDPFHNLLGSAEIESNLRSFYSPLLFVAILSLGLLTKKAWILFLWILCAGIYSVSSFAPSWPEPNPALLVFPAVALCGVGVFVVSQFLPKRFKTLPCYLYILLAFLSGGRALCLVWGDNHASSFVFAAQSREDYLRSRLKGYEAIQLINSSDSWDGVHFIQRFPPLFYLDVPISGGGRIFPAVQELFALESAKGGRQIKLIFVDNYDCQVAVHEGSLGKEEMEKLNEFLITYFSPVMEKAPITVWRRKDAVQ